MNVPSREARLAHARQHRELWNAKKKDEWIASWRTIATGNVRMFDPVGTKEKHGFDHFTSDAYDMLRCASPKFDLAQAACTTATSGATPLEKPGWDFGEIQGIVSAGNALARPAHHFA